MAGFTNGQWNKIDSALSANSRRYSLPARRSKSVVIGSFNALKLGKATNSAKRWDFLTKFSKRFDLLALQEVTDDLGGIRRLHDSLGSSYDLLVSDTTGAAPGSSGLRERLAFLYKPSRIELGEVVSDITIDRSAVVSKLQQDIDTWRKFFKDLEESGKKLSEVAHPDFSTFIRTPHCASFSIKARGNGKPIDFLGVNAHTLFGKSKLERNREFKAMLGLAGCFGLSRQSGCTSKTSLY